MIPMHTGQRWRPSRGVVVGTVVLALLALAPFVGLSVPWILPGPISSPGSLLVIGIALAYAGLAMSYDVVFGYTGLLSLGHAMFYAMGAYTTNLLMKHADITYFAAVGLAVIGIALAAVLIGAISLRVRGIAFAMVTLAFAEALAIFILSDPLRFTGGEEGLAIVGAQLPDLLRGVANTRWMYWLALSYTVLVLVVCRSVVRSHAGRTFQAIRENEDRVEMLGLIPFPFKLMVFVISATLAGLGGAIHLVLVRSSSPSLAGVQFTLALLIMVVVGGAGRLWGAAVGAAAYGILTLRLNALGTSGVLDGLPDPIRRTLSEPLFILGTTFVVLVLFAPGGIASIVERARLRFARARSRRRPAGV